MIFPRALQPMQSARLHDLCCWTTVRIVLGLVSESALRKDSLPPWDVLLLGQHIPEMRFPALLLTRDVVLDRPVFVISDYGVDGVLSVALVLLHHREQFFVFGNAAGCRFHGGNHSLRIVHHSMVMVAGTRWFAALAYDRRIRVGRAHRSVAD